MKVVLMFTLLSIGAVAFLGSAVQGAGYNYIEALLCLLVAAVCFGSVLIAKAIEKE